MFSEPKKLGEQRLVEEEITTQDDTAGTLELTDGQWEDSSRAGRSQPSVDDAGIALPAQDGLIGKTIGGHYLINSRIGTGGMSSVYEARHLLLDKTVAIKIITAGRSMDSKALMRFQQEAKAASALNHPNIATVNEFGQDAEGSPFLVMEYVQGKSLSQVIKEEGKLEYGRSVAIMLQLCDALHYAHEKSVIHRDIKPANIILTRDSSGLEVAKIVDFGIAKILSKDGTDLTQTGDVFGTPSYMSPEQCLGKPADRRCDIYSLGCVFEEMLSGNPPFSAGSSLELLMKHINETPSVRHEPAVSEVILRALEKDPADRFSSAKEMSEALKALENDNRLILQSQVPSRRRQSMALLVGGVITAIVVLAAIYCLSIAKNETQQLCIGFALLIYIGSLIQLAVNQRVKKR